MNKASSHTKLKTQKEISEREECREDHYDPHGVVFPFMIGSSWNRKLNDENK